MHAWLMTVLIAPLSLKYVVLLVVNDNKSGHMNEPASSLQIYEQVWDLNLHLNVTYNPVLMVVLGQHTRPCDALAL